jgi:type VI protein secretion system component VasK
MSERFDYICALLQRARSTLCPLNGVVTVLPFAALQDIMIAEEMPDCIRRDLRSIRQTAMLCCPVTVVISGMETAAGFSELVRRVGTPRAKNSRFGKGFHVRNTPDGENLEALAAEACGAFEDWVYTLFREEDGLNKPGNGKLYSLLCTIRGQLRQRLRNLLLRGFSADPSDGGADGAPELFSGCYFAATGDTPDRQAFVRSILDKVAQLEEEIEWTDEALEEDERYRRLSSASMVVNSLLVVAIVVLVALHFWSGSG